MKIKSQVTNKGKSVYFITTEVEIHKRHRILILLNLQSFGLKIEMKLVIDVFQSHFYIRKNQS